MQEGPYQYLVPAGGAPPVILYCNEIGKSQTPWDIIKLKIIKKFNFRIGTRRDLEITVLILSRRMYPYKYEEPTIKITTGPTKNRRNISWRSGPEQVCLNIVFEYRANILCLQHEQVCFRAYKHVLDGLKVQIGLFFTYNLY